MAAEQDSFFSRWSQRKAQVRSGQPLEADPPPPAEATEDAERGAPAKSLAQPVDAEESVASTPPEPPVPTLEDVAGLSSQSDFKPFVARHVPAEVRNAAVRKLFADPHFNVMDGLDIYIDDYSQPSPLSAAMMAKMVGAQFLKLVDDPDEDQKMAGRPALADDVPEAETTISETGEVRDDDGPLPSTLIAETEPTPDDHTDLQLQPDHAPESPGSGGGAG